MVRFQTTILQFAQQGEKTGWTYIRIPQTLAAQLSPGNKKTFRVKGKLDDFAIKSVALLPMGGGDFIMALNAGIRKATMKRKGDRLKVQLEPDQRPLRLSRELLACLEDEPKAFDYFNSLAKSHQGYFSKWIESAKTEPTKTRRIAQAISAMSKKWDYGRMLRSLKREEPERRADH